MWTFMTIEKLKKFGKYVGYHEEYGFVYTVEGTLYSLKGGKIKEIKEELLV